MKTQKELNELWNDCQRGIKSRTDTGEAASCFYEEVARVGGHRYLSAWEEDRIVNEEFLEVLKAQRCTVLHDPLTDQAAPDWIVFWPEKQEQAEPSARTRQSTITCLQDIRTHVCRLIDEGLPIGEVIFGLHNFVELLQELKDLQEQEAREEQECAEEGKISAEPSPVEVADVSQAGSGDDRQWLRARGHLLPLAAQGIS